MKHLRILLLMLFFVITTSPVHTQIISEPINDTVCAGESTSFSVQVAGQNTAFQWEFLNGFTWVPVNDNNFYSGSTTAELTIIQSNIDMNQNSYRCLVYSNGDQIWNDTSEVTVLSIIPVPILESPISGVDRACYNSTEIPFSVVPLEGEITYEWTVPDGAIVASGAGSPEIRVNFGHQSGYITVHADNQQCFGNTLSQNIEIIPQITTTPVVHGPHEV